MGVFGAGTVNSLKRVVKRTLYLVNIRKVQKLREEYEKLDRFLTLESQKGGEYSVYMYDRYDTVWRTEDFIGTGGQYSTLTFEGHEFTCPYNYDAVLRKTYGDYMKLPPKEKQVPIHTYTAYYKKQAY